MDKIINIFKYYLTKNKNNSLTWGPVALYSVSTTGYLKKNLKWRRYIKASRDFRMNTLQQPHQNLETYSKLKPLQIGMLEVSKVVSKQLQIAVKKLSNHPKITVKMPVKLTSSWF